MLSIVRPISVADELLFVDGMARSGKSTACSLTASLKRVEIERMDMIYDYIGYLHSLGKLETDAAVAMSRTVTNSNLYDTFLTRNVNFRWKDKSSIFHYPYPFKYLKRLLDKDKDAVIQKLEEIRPIFQNHTHNQLEHAYIHFEAHANTLRIINVVRHPVTLAHAWWKTGHGENLCESKWNPVLCISKNGSSPAHHLAVGWEGEYAGMAPVDRVIHMHHGYMIRASEAVAALPLDQRERVLIVRSSSLFGQPLKAAETFAEFLKTETTPATRRAISRLQNAKGESQEDISRQYDAVTAASTTESRDLLDKMISIYDANSVDL